MYYKIVSIINTEKKIKMNIDVAKKLGISTNKTIILSYGIRKKDVNIEICTTISKQIVEIEQSIFNDLLISKNMEFELEVIKDQLIVGPVIGFLVKRRATKLYEDLDFHLPFLTHFQYIRGAIIFFTEEQVDSNREIIHGYLFKGEKDNVGLWEKGEFPIPKVIYRRSAISSDTIKQFSRLGIRLFNSHYFDKWEFYQLLKPRINISRHIPLTEIEVDILRLDQFIEKSQGAYFKSKVGSQGKGLYYITKKGAIYHLEDKHKNVQQLSKNEMIDFIKKRPYFILQEPINLKKYQDRNIDYRLIVQKDSNGNWCLTGVVGRFGMINGVTTNFQQQGFALSGYEALKLQFGYSDLEAYKKLEEMGNLSMEISEALEEVGGLYADLGIDAGLDIDGKVWIIEVNKRPDHGIALYLKDKRLYWEAKSLPLMYAKKIAMEP